MYYCCFKMNSQRNVQEYIGIFFFFYRKQLITKIIFILKTKCILVLDHYLPVLFYSLELTIHFLLFYYSYLPIQM